MILVRLGALIATLFGFGATTAFEAAASPASPIRPTGKWVTDFAENRCLLSREYGQPAKPLTLVFEPNAMGDQMRLVVISAGDIDVSRRVSGTIETAPSGKRMTVDSVASQVGNRRLVRHDFDMEATQLADLRTATMLTIVANPLLEVRLEVLKLGDALKVLDECRADLLEKWGLDRAQQARFVQAPRASGGDIRSVYRADDYPPYALARNEQGKARIRVRVEPTGRVSACDILDSSGSQLLDDESCHIAVKRGRFSPALDVDGRPMLSFVVTEIAWRLSN